ncbi:hypothetical protein JL722_12267 [Aureococcus anophagefferens]|nr:hypothetical protein JL722_12267 [Aureococcus anophagefferens]
MAQRGNHLGTLDFEEIAARGDCATVDVPTSAVGFVMGSKGATLRELESRHNAFLVFDNDTVRDDAKRMYVLGGAENRDRVIAETLEAVDARNLASAEKRYLAPWSEIDDRRRAYGDYARRRRRLTTRPAAGLRRPPAPAGRPARARPARSTRARSTRAPSTRDWTRATPRRRRATRTTRYRRGPDDDRAARRRRPRPYRDYRAAPPPRRDYAPPEPRAYDPYGDRRPRHDPCDDRRVAQRR